MLLTEPVSWKTVPGGSDHGSNDQGSVRNSNKKINRVNALKNGFIFVIIEFERKSIRVLILPLSFPKRSLSTVFCCAFLVDFEIFVRTGPCNMNLHQTKQNMKITFVSRFFLTFSKNIPHLEGLPHPS